MTNEQTVAREPEGASVSPSKSRHRTFERSLLIAWSGALVLALCAQGWYLHELRNKVTELESTASWTGSTLPTGNLDKPASSQRMWDPFAEMQRMQAQIDQRFERLFAERGADSRLNAAPEKEPSPAVSVNEKHDRFVVQAQLPAADLNNVNVRLNGQLLTIEGSRSAQQQESNKAGNLLEQTVDSYARSITLPQPVAPTGMTTELKDGVLTVTIPKLSRG